MLPTTNCASLTTPAGRCRPGAEGELLVRGPYTFNGYFRAESDNARCFDPDGFYRSGDLVRRHADGYLEVTGRVKDVIHRGGETIAAGTSKNTSVPPGDLVSRRGRAAGSLSRRKDLRCSCFHRHRRLR